MRQWLCVLVLAVAAGLVSAAGDVVVTNIRLRNDRWPDATDLRQFGLDACRLENAKTDTQKALAVWRWIRIFSTSTRGGPPREPTDTAGTIRQVHDDAYKILNVYGTHHCAGLSRVYEYVWRALGYRATKCFFHGHTVAAAQWRDEDGAVRWHMMDTSEGWYAYTRDGSRIASAADLAWDFSLAARPSKTPITESSWTFGYWGWIHCPHGRPLQKLPRLSLAKTESFFSLWGNLGKPSHDNIGGLRGRKHFEHGPYVVRFGNSRQTFTADLPEQQPAAQIFRRAFRYVIAESDLHLGYVRPEGGALNVSVSVDGGRTWGSVWQAANTGEQREIVPLAAGKPGPDSLRGRYDVLVKIERSGGAKLTALTWDTHLQHSNFALPTLWPGNNRIHVEADLPAGRALKITYDWQTADGQPRRNVALIRKTPAQYTIVCAGKQWADVVCTKLAYENVPAGAGDEAVTVLEHTGPRKNDVKVPGPFPTERIISGNWAPKLAHGAAAYAARLSDGRERIGALAAIRVLGDAAVAGAVRKAVLDEPLDMRFRSYALQTLWALDPKAGGELGAQIVLGSARLAVSPKAASDEVWAFKGLAALVAARTGHREILPVLPARWTAAAGTAWVGRWSFVKAAGILGGKDGLAAIKKMITPAIEKGWVDTIELSAIALGGIGDPAAADVLMQALRHGGDYCRPYVMDALAACGVTRAAPQLGRYLTHRDELMRFSAFKALRKLDPTASRRKLIDAAAREKVGWLRRFMGTQLGERS